MNVTGFEKKENNTAVLTVAVDAARFNEALDSVYKKMRGQIAVPGFRKGKAPRKIIENLYGASTFYSDALDELIPEVCAFGIKEKELRTVGYPKLGDIDVQDDKSVSMVYTVSLYPDVEIGEYRGLHAVKPPVNVPDSAVDAEVESIRLRNATIETVDRPAINGDTVVIDYEGSVDGVNFEGGTAQMYELTLGSNSFIPGFEAQVQGMQKGEERDINVTFPEQYHSEELAGKNAVFKVKVHEISSKVLPDADDEFAKDVSEFDTLAEYKADIRAKLEGEREADADNFFENGLLEKLSEGVTGEIPEDMFEEQIDSSINNLRSQLAQYGMDFDNYLNMSGTNEASFRADARPSAEKQVKISLALEKIAEKEAFEIADEDVDAFYTDMAERYGVTVDIAKSSIEKTDAERELKMRAAIKLVRESGIADDPPAAPEATTDGEAADVAAETKEPKAKKAPAKKKAEPADAEKPKNAPAKKAPAPEETEKKTAAKQAEEPEAEERE
ncbi:MAG: trigger factor [Clostridiales bacterium]|nr:trigger factor [Clostridiales bacterium]